MMKWFSIENNIFFLRNEKIFIINSNTRTWYMSYWSNLLVIYQWNINFVIFYIKILVSFFSIYSIINLESNLPDNKINLDRS